MSDLHEIGEAPEALEAGRCEICGSDEDTTVAAGLVWCPICQELVKPGEDEGINHIVAGVTEKKPKLNQSEML